MLKKAKDIIDGDVFEYNGHTHVAIDAYVNGSVWVSSREKYKAARKTPWYTNSGLLEIDGETVVSCEHIPTIAECEESEDRWEDSFFDGGL